MAATTTSRKRKGRGNIQKKANGNACVLPDMTRFTLLVLQKKKFKKKLKNYKLIINRLKKNMI